MRISQSQAKRDNSNDKPCEDKNTNMSHNAFSGRS